MSRKYFKVLCTREEIFSLTLKLEGYRHGLIKKISICSLVWKRSAKLIHSCQWSYIRGMLSKAESMACTVPAFGVSILFQIILVLLQQQSRPLLTLNRRSRLETLMRMML